MRPDFERSYVKMSNIPHGKIMYFDHVSFYWIGEKMLSLSSKKLGGGFK